MAPHPLRLAPLLAAAAVAAAPAPAPATQWVCTPINSTQLAPGAVWRQLNCTSPAPGLPFWGVFGPLVVNVVEADLSAPGLRLLPVAAAPAAQLLPLNAMAAAGPKGLLAGINGGYFFRVDVGSFVDTVCQGKTRADALQPPAVATPNTGVGDCASVVGGAALSSNCDEPGFSRPAVLTLNGTASYVSVLHRGDAPPAGLALDSIAAGPNLVTTNASGTFIDIPSDDDNIGNILEHSANTAVGLTANGTAFLVTLDGFDGCFPLDPTCGTNAYSMAYFMRDYLGCASAMGMDQGGSTTMWVAGQGQDGIVSKSGGGPRPIFNGLFLLAE